MERTIAVIPCHNEAGNIGSVVSRCRPYVDRILVVDDGSTDNTPVEAALAGACVITRKHQGAGAAVSQGLDWLLDHESAGSILVMLDGDGQHDPDDIPGFLSLVRSTCDIAIGSRDGDNVPFLRWLGNWIFYVLRNTLSSMVIPDAECGFRAMRAGVLANLKLETPHFGYCEEMAIKARAAGYRIGSVPIRSVYGKDLHKYSFKKQLKRGLEIPATILRWRWELEISHKQSKAQGGVWEH